MKKTAFISIVLICLVSFNFKMYGQQNSAGEQNKKLSRGINIIGYDKELWKDHTRGRFKEGYFEGKNIKQSIEFNSLLWQK